MSVAATRDCRHAAPRRRSRSRTRRPSGSSGSWSSPAARRAPAGGMAGVGRGPALARPARARDHLRAHRVRDHGRLSPAVHPPQLQDHAHGASAARRARLDGRRGAGDRVGRDAPQAPPLLRPCAATRTALTSTTRRDGAERCADSATRTSAGCSAARTWPIPARYAKDLLADRDLRFISRTFPLWVVAGLAVPFGLGVALTGIARRRAHRAAVGRGGARVPSASRDLQHQLALPLLRPAAVLHRR